MHFFLTLEMHVRLPFPMVGSCPLSEYWSTKAAKGWPTPLLSLPPPRPLLLPGTRQLLPGSRFLTGRSAFAGSLSLA